MLTAVTTHVTPASTHLVGELVYRHREVSPGVLEQHGAYGGRGAEARHRATQLDVHEATSRGRPGRVPAAAGHVTAHQRHLEQVALHLATQPHANSNQVFAGPMILF